MQTITDSVTMNPSSAASLADFRRRALQAKSSMIRVSTDGAVEVMDQDTPAGSCVTFWRDAGDALAQRGRRRRKVDARDADPSERGPGRDGIRPRDFPADSLSRTGDVAFISMKGSLSRISLPGVVAPAAGYETSGTLSGTIQIDRRLGWITDSRSTIQVRSTIAAASASKGQAQRGPMLVRTRITQWIRAMRAR